MGPTSTCCGTSSVLSSLLEELPEELDDPLSLSEPESLDDELPNSDIEDGYSADTLSPLASPKSAFGTRSATPKKSLEYWSL